jgi:hypothetical protein
MQPTQGLAALWLALALRTCAVALSAAVPPSVANSNLATACGARLEPTYPLAAAPHTDAIEQALNPLAEMPQTAPFHAGALHGRTGYPSSV